MTNSSPFFGEIISLSTYSFLHVVLDTRYWISYVHASWSYKGIANVLNGALQGAMQPIHIGIHKWTLCNGGARLRHILQLIHRNPPKPTTSNNGRYTYTLRGICTPSIGITDRGLAVSLAGYHADCRSGDAPDYMLQVRMRLTMWTQSFTGEKTLHCNRWNLALYIFRVLQEEWSAFQDMIVHIIFWAKKFI